MRGATARWRSRPRRQPPGGELGLGWCRRWSVKKSATCRSVRRLGALARSRRARFITTPGAFRGERWVTEAARVCGRLAPVSRETASRCPHGADQLPQTVRLTLACTKPLRRPGRIGACGSTPVDRGRTRSAPADCPHTRLPRAPGPRGSVDRPQSRASGTRSRQPHHRSVSRETTGCAVPWMRCVASRVSTGGSTRSPLADRRQRVASVLRRSAITPAPAWTPRPSRWRCPTAHAVTITTVAGRHASLDLSPTVSRGSASDPPWPGTDDAGAREKGVWRGCP